MVGAQQTPLVIAHRGASGYRPEHTAAAYRLAAALGADAVEPDVVLSRDGVPVVRHENEIGGTTDVADHPEFADRYTTKTVDGVKRAGWFTEDFTWKELQTLRCRERLSRVRSRNRAWDGRERMLRLREVFEIIDRESARWERDITVVVEIKHDTYFRALGFDIAHAVATECVGAGWADRAERLVVESFEAGVLDRFRALGVPSSRVFLLEDKGAPADEIAAGGEAHEYAWYRSEGGLQTLTGRVDGISVAKASILLGGSRHRRPRTSDLALRAREHGLSTYVWTLRPENAFVHPAFRRGEAPSAWGNWQAEYRAILASGVSGVFADQPDIARLALNDWLSG